MNFQSLGFGISSGAFRAFTFANDVYAHNIANAATEGYSQQYAVLTENIPMLSDLGVGQIGTGVHV